MIDLATRPRPAPGEDRKGDYPCIVPITVSGIESRPTKAQGRASSFLEGIRSNRRHRTRCSFFRNRLPAKAQRAASPFLA
jgi:hypothetical protein